MPDLVWHDPSSVFRGQPSRGQLSTEKLGIKTLTNKPAACKHKMLQESPGQSSAETPKTLPTVLSAGELASFQGSQSSFRAMVEESSLEASSLEQRSFAKSSFEESSLEENSLDQRSFEKSSLEPSSFENSSLEDSNLEERSLEPSSFEDSSFEESSFEPSSFEDGSLEDSSLEERSLEPSSFEDSSFEESGFEPSSFEDSSLEDNSFQDSSLESSSFADSSLEEDPFYNSSFEATASKRAQHTVLTKAASSFELRKESLYSGIWLRTASCQGGVLKEPLQLSQLELDTEILPQLCGSRFVPEKAACISATYQELILGKGMRRSTFQ